jgi:hypothetical protein
VRYRSFASIAVLAATFAFVALAIGDAAGQAPRAAKTWTQPKTAWGDPDLQGIWDPDGMAGAGHVPNSSARFPPM